MTSAFGGQRSIQLSYGSATPPLLPNIPHHRNRTPQYGHADRSHPASSAAGANPDTPASHP